MERRRETKRKRENPFTYIPILYISILWAGNRLIVDEESNVTGDLLECVAKGGRWITFQIIKSIFGCVKSALLIFLLIYCETCYTKISMG